MGFRRALLSAAIALVLSLTSAASGNNQVAALAGEATNQTPVEMDLLDFAFAPDRVIVAPGATVMFELTNVGEFNHQLAIAGMGAQWESSRVPPGASSTLSVTFRQAGVYEMWCPVRDHRERGMVGMVIVGAK